MSDVENRELNTKAREDVKTREEELAELWAEMDRLALEVSVQWTGSPDAVEAVREGRRAL